MRGRGFAFLLFWLALTAQLVAPLAAAAGRFDGSLIGCSAAAASQGSAIEPGNAPTAPHHGRQACLQCPLMAGGALPLPELGQAVVLRSAAAAVEARPTDSRTLLSFVVLNDGAPPRAPPSRG